MQKGLKFALSNLRIKKKKDDKQSKTQKVFEHKEKHKKCKGPGG